MECRVLEAFSTDVGHLAYHIQSKHEVFIHINPISSISSPHPKRCEIFYLQHPFSQRVPDPDTIGVKRMFLKPPLNLLLCIFNLCPLVSSISALRKSFICCFTGVSVHVASHYCCVEQVSKESTCHSSFPFNLNRFANALQDAEVMIAQQEIDMHEPLR